MDTDLEQERLKLEQAKIGLELRKLEIEREKSRWSAVGAVVPIVVVLATITYGAFSLQETAKYQFQTKVAELAVSAPDPDQAKNRAKMLALLFAEMLPKTFHERLQNLDPAKYGIYFQGDKYTVDAKFRIFEAIARNPSNRAELIRTWQVLFPDDKWAQEMK